MKAAIITWCTYPNYGTFLQVYALQQTLKKLSITNKVVDDYSIVMRKNGPIWFLKLRIQLEELRCGPVYYLCQRIKKRKFARFKKRLLNVHSSYHDLSSIDNEYDFYIIGSDQIWSPLNFNPFFFANFTKKPKISYAPSIGVSAYPENLKDRVRSLLASFSSLSVREEEGAKALMDIIDRPISVVLDPTLLLEKADWDLITLANKTITEDYNVCYLLTFNESYVAWAQAETQKKRRKLLIFSTLPQFRKYADIYYPAGPEEFVDLIKHAKTIFTDSFHATIFSIIFEKDFITFKRFKENEGKNQNSRLRNLFSLIDVSDRFLSEADLSLYVEPKCLNYIKIKGLIAEKRKESLSYLTEAIDSVCSKFVPK